mgnify:CR=1 FL=1
MIEIRKCLNKDIKKLTLFINNHWKQNHALVVSQELLDWQHKSSNNSYNFIIALEKNEIIGILGYINNNRFEKLFASLSEKTFLVKIFFFILALNLVYLGLHQHEICKHYYCLIYMQIKLLYFHAHMAQSNLAQ